jgi:hypothetical protein
MMMMSVRVRCTAILVSIIDNEIEGRGRVADKSCGVVGARAWDVLRIILTSPLEAVLKLCGRRVVKLPALEMWRRAVLGWLRKRAEQRARGCWR